MADKRNETVFNDIHTHFAGGGNAAVRPFQLCCDAIGMPTGPYPSLQHLFHVPEECMKISVKEIIHKACFRIIDLFLAHPEKDTLYYSCKSETDDELGLGIFAGNVGYDVVQYTTKCIKNLPLMMEFTRKNGHYPCESAIDRILLFGDADTVVIAPAGLCRPTP
jgi:hypothetical protein